MLCIRQTCVHSFIFPQIRIIRYPSTPSPLFRTDAPPTRLAELQFPARRTYRRGSPICTQPSAAVAKLHANHKECRVGTGKVSAVYKPIKLIKRRRRSQQEWRRVYSVQPVALIASARYILTNTDLLLARDTYRLLLTALNGRVGSRHAKLPAAPSRLAASLHL
ncbi:hypothetical protein BDW02DRAFT_567447 [Decorospora gaudefroyi]|uniref:Uncharacterized protein n=1 Tax=Decorospora gaudefroyi TaxID=184978 RepID=A0A6A5KJY3_9PLEO|nr:hypothetical protein BDW02DRAFT_567447 [Decorospora gaudefroyi]